LSVDHRDFSSSVLRGSGKLYLHGASAAPDAEIPLMMSCRHHRHFVGLIGARDERKTSDQFQLVHSRNRVVIFASRFRATARASDSIGQRRTIAPYRPPRPQFLGWPTDPAGCPARPAVNDGSRRGNGGCRLIGSLPISALTVGELSATAVSRPKFACDGRPEHFAQLCRTPWTESGFKSRLSL
jgi:hypothetical protein